MEKLEAIRDLKNAIFDMLGGVIVSVLVVFGIVKVLALEQEKKIGGVAKKKEIPKSTINESYELDDSDKSSSYPYFSEDADDEPDEEILELMENHDLDQEEAENVQRIMDEEGLDEDDAVELKDEL